MSASAQGVPVDLAGRYLAPGGGGVARAATVGGADRVTEPAGAIEGTYTPFSDAYKPPRAVEVSLAGSQWTADVRLGGEWQPGDRAQLGSLAGSASVIVEGGGPGFRFVDPDDGVAFFQDLGGARTFRLEGRVDPLGQKTLRVTALDGLAPGLFGMAAGNAGGPSGATAGFEVSLGGASGPSSDADLEVLRFETARPVNALYLHCDDPWAQPGATILYRLGMAALAQPIGGFQAFLSEIDPSNAQTYVTGLYTPTPFPSARFWGDPIPPSLFLAAGITPGGAMVQSDARLADLYFLAAAPGRVGLAIRPDNGSGFPTLFADDLGTPYYPARLESNTVLVDSSTPLITDISATQKGESVLDWGMTPGTVVVEFRAEDLLAGLGPRPLVRVDVYPPGPGPEDPIVRARSSPDPGRFIAEVEIDGSGASKPGTIFVEAEDDAGNVATWSGPFVPGIDVLGEVDLQDFLGDPRQRPVGLEVRTEGSTAPLYSRSVILDAFGRFVTRFPIGPGRYDMAAKGGHWLRRTLSNVEIGWPTHAGLAFSLVNGDCSDDNEVDIGDFAILSAHFGATLGEPGYFSQADLNGDEEIDIGDFAVLSSNFGRIGDE